MNLIEIKEQIREVTTAIANLKEEKRKSERERKNGEMILEEFIEAKRKILSDVESFENKIKTKADSIEGEFGEYYKNEIMDSIKKSRIHDLDSNGTNIISNIRNRIISLDDIINDIYRQIVKKSELLNKLKALANEVSETIEDIIPGGK